MLEEDRKAALSKILPHAGEQVEGGPPLSKESLAYQQQEEEVWRGTRTGYARPTLSSIRSKSQQSGGGSGVNAANSTTGPNRIRSSSRNHPLTTSSSQHLGASTSSHRGRLNGGSSASASDSDSDETLVDSWTEREVNDYLVSRTLTPNDVRQPQDLVRPLRGNIGYTAELIWILRPLLYGECDKGGDACLKQTFCRTLFAALYIPTLLQCWLYVDGAQSTRLPSLYPLS